MGIIGAIRTKLNFLSGNFKIHQITKIENSSYCVSNHDIKYQPDFGQKYELTPTQWKAFLFIFFREDPDFYFAELQSDKETFKSSYLRNKCYYDYFKNQGKITKRFYAIFNQKKPTNIFLCEYALNYQDELTKRIDPRRYAYNAYLINNFGLNVYDTKNKSGSLKSIEYVESIKEAAEAVLSDIDGFKKINFSKTTPLSLKELAAFLERLN